jgi:hypothetical protein
VDSVDRDAVDRDAVDEGAAERDADDRDDDGAHARAKSRRPARAVIGSAANGTPASAPSVTNAMRLARTSPKGASTSVVRRAASRPQSRSARAIRA